MGLQPTAMSSADATSLADLSDVVMHAQKMLALHQGMTNTYKDQPALAGHAPATVYGANIPVPFAGKPFAVALENTDQYKAFDQERGLATASTAKGLAGVPRLNEQELGITRGYLI